ncbi:hypothetical protein SAMN04488074_117131 [Lentzea albidocapillata subsp. violacea]|uniref:Uncharacterized protein n=2 Tax=Lentzea albidocapillata TaxID=40571 RepID=A0A1G9R0Q5_9PSEU|nr:hypothetical protein SAMN04488074_117131 [Lentzea albidocapillata subsp. violacea]
MIILSITSPFAFVAYRLLRRRLASLFNALKSTGLLLNSHESTSKISGGIERLERVVDLSPVRWIGIFSASVAMTTWLYWRNLREGDLFNTLATTAADGSTNTAQLRDSWWANYHHHPLLAALCVFIGSIGVMYALRAGWLYLRLGFVLWATRKTTPEDLPIHYVPRWQDKSYGWSPVTGVLMLVYVSTINFGISMVSVFDMLRNEKWTLAVAGAFTLLGIVSNLTIIWTSIHRILAAHSAVGVRLRKELSDRTAPPTLTPEEAFFARQELATWRRIPVASFVGSAIKILPGLYALVQFARILFT